MSEKYCSYNTIQIETIKVPFYDTKTHSSSPRLLPIVDSCHVSASSRSLLQAMDWIDFVTSPTFILFFERSVG